MSLEIKEGAIFVSDAHFSKDRDALVVLLEALENGHLKPPQIFWMGDIFDLLVGDVGITKKRNASVIKRMNALKMPQYYFEGNHDFRLQKVFDAITVIPRKRQPLKASLQDKTVLLAHGDIFTPRLYDFYIKTVSNPLVLKILNFCNIKNGISDKIMKYNNSKNLCKKMKNFDTIVGKRIDIYKKLGAQIVVEGHFHQNVITKKEQEDILYINLPAFICNQSYFVVKLSKDPQFVEQKLRRGDG
ncbi:MAG: UDP-2,3-diacylglucosamine diphosphatase [Campylobacterota bacterium]